MFARTTRRTEPTARLLLVQLLALTCGAVGCDSLLGLYGLDPGGGNPNTLDTPTEEGTVRLTAVTFSPTSGFPQGSDPATFNVGEGTITTSGGTAGTLGRTGLYADDRFAWDFKTGVVGGFDLSELGVVAMDGYWVQPSGQTGTASMTVSFSDGSTEAIVAAAVNAGGSFGQAAGFFDTVNAPDGATIDSLSFEFDDNADADDVATLDVLELIVRE